MYIPQEVIVADVVWDHPVTRQILARCPGATVIPCDLGPEASDLEILTRYSRLYDRSLPVAQRRPLGRRIVYLHGGDRILATMAAGANAAKRCHNFVKIVPYRGACLFNCEYCWFKDPDLMPRVNVTFFDRLDQLEEVVASQPRGYDAVFTFTHYKTDCLSIEHLTGFLGRAIEYFGQQQQAYLIVLTKSQRIEPVLGLAHGRHTIMQWSLNTDQFTRRYEHGTASLATRLRAAQRVQAAGYPVVFRIDPIFAIEGWQEGYREMAREIHRYVQPAHITLGVAKFQGPDEVRQIVGNSFGHRSRLLRQESTRFTYAKASASQSYQTAANPFESTMSDMPYTYPDELRLALLSHLVACLKEENPALSIGLCEEPAEMWDALGLTYHGHKNLDCACNYTGFARS